jgi:hypothetical protein
MSRKKTNWRNTAVMEYWNNSQNRLTTAFGFNGIDIFPMIVYPRDYDIFSQDEIETQYFIIPAFHYSSCKWST